MRQFNAIIHHAVAKRRLSPPRHSHPLLLGQGDGDIASRLRNDADQVKRSGTTSMAVWLGNVGEAGDQRLGRSALPQEQAALVGIVDL